MVYIQIACVCERDTNESKCKPYVWKIDIMYMRQETLLYFYSFESSICLKLLIQTSSSYKTTLYFTTRNANMCMCVVYNTSMWD
ncbi:hypothetical protein AQUCO_07200003v1 [Aquilegia coerulea]|uniref:Uncharacterized protein n=1 Tax=Aquilegia coerulea TaxID=218851 RepID=A0A2G5C9X8_AQUCA|nr:hypothetical protein AQUCO_07200003v1 [Aquilegia coerulea]